MRLGEGRGGPNAGTAAQVHLREQMAESCEGDGKLKEQVLVGERPQRPAGKAGKESLEASARRRETAPQLAEVFLPLSLPP